MLAKRPVARVREGEGILLALSGPDVLGVTRNESHSEKSLDLGAVGTGGATRFLVSCRSLLTHR